MELGSASELEGVLITGWGCTVDFNSILEPGVGLTPAEMEWASRVWPWLDKDDEEASSGINWSTGRFGSLALKACNWLLVIACLPV